MGRKSRRLLLWPDRRAPSSVVSAPGGPGVRGQKGPLHGLQILITSLTVPHLLSCIFLK